MPTEKKQYKFPKAIGACADRLYNLQEARRKQQKIVDKLADEESQLKEHIINTLPKSKAQGVAGRLALAKIEQKDVPSPKDWTKIFAYIKRNNAFELLQRRLSSTAVQERWDAKKSIPGIEKFKVTTVSLTKLKR